VNRGQNGQATCGENPLACCAEDNGRITCADAERHGSALAPSGQLAYQVMRDGDRVACE